MTTIWEILNIDEKRKEELLDMIAEMINSDNISNPGKLIPLIEKRDDFTMTEKMLLAYTIGEKERKMRCTKRMERAEFCNSS